MTRRTMKRKKEKMGLRRGVITSLTRPRTISVARGETLQEVLQLDGEESSSKYVSNNGREIKIDYC